MSAQQPAASASTQSPATLTIARPDDWHLHVRDGAMLAAVLPHTARQFGRAIIMPNLRPPVTTTAMAGAYRERILAALPKEGAGAAFRAADDALSHRQHAARRNPPRARKRLRARREAVSGGRDDQFRRRRDRSGEVREDARSDAGKRHAAARAWRSDRSGDRPVRSREGVHRPRDDAAAPRFSGAEGGVRAHHDEGCRRLRARGERPDRRDDHRASSAVQPQCDLCRRDSAALLLPAGV